MEDELRSAFHAHKEGQTKFTRRMAITIADQFGMSPMLLIVRLEKIGLLKRGSANWFYRNGGITSAHIEECRSDRNRSKCAS